MSKLKVFIIGLFLALSSTPGSTQGPVGLCTFLAGGSCQRVTATTPLPVTGTFTPSAASANFSPVAPAAATATKSTLLGGQYNSTQATFTNTQQGSLQISSRGALLVATGVDGFAVTNAGTFATQASQTGTWTVQPGNTANTTPWLATNIPSAAAGAATTSASSTAAASNLVVKSSAGNLYALTVSIGATSGYVMLFDATSLPGDGAVTPVWCQPVVSSGTNGGLGASWNTPKRFGTGITVGFSTTGCFTLTASATAAFFGGYQ